MNAPVDLGTENDERMARLREALVLGNGFQLVIVQVELGEQREEVLRRLAGWSERDGMPRLELMRIAPGESPVTRLEGRHDGVVLVGLEADASAERTQEMVTELNWSRDRLPEFVSGPLVLVISQRVQSTLFERAPDFYSWRMHSTGIVPPRRGFGRPFPWLSDSDDDPATLEAIIAETLSLEPRPDLELARLYERLAWSRASYGQFAPAEAALDTANAYVDRRGTAEHRVELLVVRARIEQSRFRFDDAARWIALAVQQAASAPLSAGLAARLHQLRGENLAELDDIPAARSELQCALATLDTIGDNIERGALRYKLARLAWREGHPNIAAVELSHALGLFRMAEDPAGESEALMSLALIASAMGRGDEAQRYATDALNAAERSGSVNRTARATATLASIALSAGQVDLARATLASDVVANDPFTMGMLADVRSRLAMRSGDYAAAEPLMHAAREAYEQLGVSEFVASVSLRLGYLGRATNRPDLATTNYDAALRHGNASQRAMATLELCRLAYDRGENTAELADRLASATHMLSATGAASHADWARRYRAGVLLALGRTSEARQELTTAIAGFEARGQAEPAEELRTWLRGLSHLPQQTEPTQR